MVMCEILRGFDDNFYSVMSDSFWDVGNFKWIVKWIDDGVKLCDEFMKFVVEWVEIEVKYVIKLKVWFKKWEEIIKSGLEYGIMEGVMWGCVSEVEFRVDIYMLCCDKVMDEVYEFIKKWKIENYYKGIF